MFLTMSYCFGAKQAFSQPLWDLAMENQDILRISTLFTAQNVRDYLSDEASLDEAIDWCKRTGITRVFIETFRSGYQAERVVLENAKFRFESAGIEVSGCITPVKIGKVSSNWESFSCYTSKETRKEIQKLFEFTASIFDVIMIDDFFCTDCECKECKTASKGQTMSEYRCNLMSEVSRKNVFNPAKAINPKVKIIIKYPRWYDHLHLYGYDVLKETDLYDIIWVGTETRDNDFFKDNRTSSGGVPQYESFYAMRWLDEIGGSKTGGGWFDALGTTAVNYLEQARQTILGGAREMMLYDYGGLISETNNYDKREGTGIANIEALKKELPALFELAGLIRNKSPKGILAPKPANSDPDPNFYGHNNQKGDQHLDNMSDPYVFDYIGMMGLPLVPSGIINTRCDAAFFSVHALKDPDFEDKLIEMLSQKKPILATKNLLAQLDGIDPNQYENLILLDVHVSPQGDLGDLLKLGREELNTIRDIMLVPFGITIDAPNNVAFYLFGDDIMLIENFNNQAVDVTVNTDSRIKAKVLLTLPSEGNLVFECSGKKLEFQQLPARALVALKY